MKDTYEDRLSHLERQVALLKTYSVEAFWTALDCAYETLLKQREPVCIVCGRAGPRMDFAVLTDRCVFGGDPRTLQCPACDAVFGPQKYLDLSEEFVSRDYAMLYTRHMKPILPGAKFALSAP